MAAFTVYYFAMKVVFFTSLLRSFVKFEPLQKHSLFLAGLYTGAVAFLSWIFLPQWRSSIGPRAWEIWLGQTFLMTAVYFWLLRRFDEGLLFWLLVVAGAGIVMF